MNTTLFMKLITIFEMKACGIVNLYSAMLHSFGMDWETVPEYCELADYISKFMTYDQVSGEWVDL